MRSTTLDKQQKPSAFRLLVSGLFWLAVWQVGASALHQELFLPAPAAVLSRLSVLVRESSFWTVVFGSLGRVFSGFLLGLLAGTLLAALTSRFSLFHALVLLPMGMIRATPVASFVILALLFLKSRFFSIFIAFLMVLPIVWSNLHEAFTHLNRDWLEMAQSFHLSHRKIISAILLPSVLPYFLSAVRVGLGFAWKSGIAGEVIAIPANSIGLQLYNAKIYLETVDLFAWTVVIILLSVLMEQAVFGVLNHLLPRHRKEDSHAGSL